jgi:hypothetical protein
MKMLRMDELHLQALQKHRRESNKLGASRKPFNSRQTETYT